MWSLLRHPNYYQKVFVFFFHHIQKMPSQKIEMKFNELSNNMNIKLINELKLYTFLIKDNTDNGKIIK